MRVACGGYVDRSSPLLSLTLQRGKFHVCRNTSKALQKDFRPSHVRRNNTKALQKYFRPSGRDFRPKRSEISSRGSEISIVR